jgi:hypothetical protein
MTSGFRADALLVALLTLAMLGCTSCIYVNGCDVTANCRRVVPLSAPLEPDSTFTADTDDGSIRLEGTQANECRLDATIVAHARTEEQAEELAEQIDVRLEPSGEGLQVVIDRPRVLRNAWFSVSLQGSLPAQTDLTLSTSDGPIDISNVTASLDARTSDGSIEIRDIDGDVRLRTSDGRIVADRVRTGTFDCHTSDGAVQLSDVTAGSLRAETSDGSIAFETVRADAATVRTVDGSIRWRDAVAANMECHSSDGAIHVEYAAEGPKGPDIRITTSDGGITLVAPPELSAEIDAATGDGSICTDLPILIRGKVGKSLRGTIGGGEGRVYLRTNDGSIAIR